MTLGEPDAKTLARQRREARTDHVIELPFHENHVEYECPECGETFEASIMIPKDEPTFSECSWDCDAFLKFIDEDHAESRRSAGKNRSLGAFASDAIATDGGTEKEGNPDR